MGEHTNEFVDSDSSGERRKLFKAVAVMDAGDQPMPLPPTGPDEQPPAADGKTVFDLDAAAEHFGWSRDALTALWETAWPPSTPVAARLTMSEVEALAQSMGDWRNEPDKVCMRKTDFGRLNDQDFALFLAMCRVRRLNPWARQVFPEFRWNSAQRRMDLVLITSIEAQRLIAHRTDVYAGNDPVQFTWAGNESSANAMDRGHPERGTIRIYRMVAGQRCAFTGEAMWEDFYPGENSNSLWDSKPHVCLAICAEACGLRRAFPQELGGLYTSYEFAKSRRGPHGGGPAPETVNAEGQFVEGQLYDGDDGQVPDEEVPHTAMGFRRALFDLGVENLAEREALIERFRGQYPGMLERDPRGFYALVIVAVRKKRKTG